VVEDLKKRYIVPQNSREIQRLTDQHEWVKGNMHGRLIKAPIDEKRCKRVLDSATADGYWLVDVMPDFPKDTEFVGFDVAPSLFMPTSLRPSNVKLLTQNLIEPFPSDWDNSFDLVHQRFILPLFKEAEIENVMASLVATMKPGAWIQLVEPDFSTPVSQPADQTKAFQMIHELTRVTMGDHAPGPKLASRLEKAGLEKVTTEIIDMIVGLQHPDAELGQRSFRNYSEVISYYHSCNKPETFGMSQEKWEKLPADFADDMRSHKTAVRHYVVWAQKPE